MSNAINLHHHNHMAMASNAAMVMPYFKVDCALHHFEKVNGVLSHVKALVLLSHLLGIHMLVIII